ncbi:MAG: hypothetical protein ACPH3N_16025, partial [Alcanivorax sediminis]|uniref:hypothetical protein n=1 Tax=Alcanivorax sediminis TaxID=2663008 RepID=UPI003C3B0822
KIYVLFIFRKLSQFFFPNKVENFVSFFRAHLLNEFANIFVCRDMQAITPNRYTAHTNTPTDNTDRQL